MPCQTALDAATLAIWEPNEPAAPAGLSAESSAVVGESAATLSACWIAAAPELVLGAVAGDEVGLGLAVAAGAAAAEGLVVAAPAPTLTGELLGGGVDGLLGAECACT